MVQELIEAGHDPLNIAAAAIKMARADEKQRPIAEIAEVKAPERREKEFGRDGKREAPRAAVNVRRGAPGRASRGWIT